MISITKIFGESNEMDACFQKLFLNIIFQKQPALPPGGSPKIPVLQAEMQEQQDVDGKKK